MERRAARWAARVLVGRARRRRRASARGCLPRTPRRKTRRRALGADRDRALVARTRTRRVQHELLGNLLDNACKWARARVELTSTAEPGAIVVTVDDDGPGLAPELRVAVLQRGVRADEAGAGSGFGLAIVRDLAELYGGSVALDASPLGGLRATLRLPG